MESGQVQQKVEEPNVASIVEDSAIASNQSTTSSRPSGAAYAKIQQPSRPLRALDIAREALKNITALPVLARNSDQQEVVVVKRKLLESNFKENSIPFDLDIDC